MMSAIKAFFASNPLGCVLCLPCMRPCTNRCIRNTGKIIKYVHLVLSDDNQKHRFKITGTAVLL